MNNSLLIVCSLIIVAKSFELGPLYDMGPLSTKMKLGSELNTKYLPLNKKDVQAAANILPIITSAMQSEAIMGGPIDPFVRSSVDLPATSASGPTLLSNLTVKELNGLRIKDLEIRLGNSSKSSIRMDAHVTAKNKIQGETFFSTIVKLRFINLPVSGYLKFIVTGLQINASIQFNLLNNNNNYTITGADFTIKAENVQMQLYVRSDYRIQNSNRVIKRAFDNIQENVVKTAIRAILRNMSEAVGTIPKEYIWRLLDGGDKITRPM